MTATYSSRVSCVRRVRWWAGPLCLGLSLAVPVSPVHGDRPPPETTITRLEFRVLDVKPDARPLRSFRYRFELYTANEEKPQKRDRIAYRSEDGILRISKPFPPFGRIYVWVDADDLEKGYRHGYGSFSYRIDAEKPTERPTIPLELGIVLTGKVLDAETGKPIVAAEVAPLKWGHHASWADWNESVKANHKESTASSPKRRKESRPGIPSIAKAS